MANELAIFDKIADPLEAIDKMGTAIAESGMFGCSNVQQGKVLAMACLCERSNPLEISRRYHIVEGNLTMKADAMLAEFQDRGGKYEVKSRTPELASIVLEANGQKLEDSFSWEEAKGETYVYGKDKKTLKTNWSTPRRRKQMLWARLVSDTVRVLMPEVVAGRYTPEEIEDSSERSDQGNGQPDAAPVDVEELAKKTAEAAKEATATEEPIDAEFQVVETPEGSTPEQRDKIREYFGGLGLTDDQIAGILAKRNVSNLPQLTREQADELLAGLAKKVSQIVDQQIGESKAAGDVHEASTAGPVSEAVVEEIKRLMTDKPEICQQVKNHLVACGKQKIAELSHGNAVTLLEGLKVNNLTAFFELKLA